ncbi:MAG: YafY family protein [Elainellaceae cyanobacterium]
MYHPTSRVLTVLELLQSHVQISGAELAERLEVDRRTVRRYITQLQDLGIPIETERGRYGAYRLCPGFKLPPLMFSENEAIALTLGLLSARKLGLESATLAVEGALAKVLRVMPLDLRDRVQAVQKTLVVEECPSNSGTVAYDVVATLGLAIEQRRQVRLCYQAYTGAVSERMIDAYGLVYRGYWYVVSYCHLRQDLRTFRLDRIRQLELLDSQFTQPHAFDPLDFVERSLANTPRQYRAEVLVRATLEEVKARVPMAIATLTVLDEGVLLACYADDLRWFSRFLLDLRLPLSIREPLELREEMQQLQADITQMLAPEFMLKEPN